MTAKPSDATGAVAPVSQPVLLTAAATSGGLPLCLAIAVWPAAPSTHQPLVEAPGDLNP